VRRASERVDAPRALPDSHRSLGSRSSPSSSGSATARRGLLQGVLETLATFPSRAVQRVKEESRRGRSTMRTASFCKVALSLFVHPGFIGSLSACHQSGGFPATGPSAQRHLSSVQRWTTSRCGSGRRCLAVGCLCSHFAPRAFSLFALGSPRPRAFLLRQVESMKVERLSTEVSAAPSCRTAASRRRLDERLEREPVSRANWPSQVGALEVRAGPSAPSLSLSLDSKPRAELQCYKRPHRHCTSPTRCARPARPPLAPRQARSATSSSQTRTRSE